jgi:hypothetical protein
VTVRWLRSRPRILLLGAAVAALVLAVLAAASFRRVADSVPAVPEPCSPHPCAAPHGFEADLSNITEAGGRVTMTVTFHNHTTREPLEAVSYRHTSPADFQLRSADGHQASPVFSSACPDWAELHVEHGASAGPRPLCFASAAGGLVGAVIVWSPDLGLLFDDVRIPLAGG